jgi:hypothetical protein
MNEIERDFLESGKAKERNGIILFSKTDALDFVKRCKQQLMGIFGIDGFYLNGDSIRPSLENSIDFSSRSKVIGADVYGLSLDFFGQRDNDLFYEIICST